MSWKSIFHTYIEVNGILVLYSLYSMESFLQLYFSHKNILRPLSVRRIHLFYFLNGQNCFLTTIFISLFQLVVAKTRKPSPPTARALATYNQQKILYIAKTNFHSNLHS